MENLDDQEIQRLIEEQLSGYEFSALEENRDAELYRLIFTELGFFPLNTEEGQLAERVVGEIEMKQERSEWVYDALLNCAVFLLIFGLTYKAIALTNTVLSSEIAQFFVSYRYVALFIVLAFCVIQFLDRYIVGYRQMH